MATPPVHKILTRRELLTLRARARREGRTLVQCHGCFDIVHPGHIRHLRFARSQGDLLLVSITADAQIAKGEGRPLIPQELRAENLAELDCVDWVYIDPRPTAAELLEEVRPDVYIKGGEYEFNHDPRFAAERSAVERHGGRVVFSSGDVVFSSTALIAQLERAADPYHGALLGLTREDELGVARLQERIESWRGLRMLVVGETVIDTYVHCDAPEVAGEGPMLSLRPIERRQYDGGAAIVARHLAAMGARPTLLTPLPAEPRAEALCQRLAGAGVEVLPLEVATPIAEKQRYLVGQQKVMKVDQFDALALDAAQQRRLLELGCQAAAGKIDGAVVADFGLGLFTPSLASSLCRSLRPLCGVLAADVSGRRGSLRAMVETDLLCPSERELREAVGDATDTLPAATWKMLEATRCGAALVTMGAEGLVAFERVRSPQRGWSRRLKGRHVPALAPVALDPLGCGDALLSAATLTLAARGSLLQAAFLGAAAAAAHAARLGNEPVSAVDLRQGVVRAHAAHLSLARSEVRPPVAPAALDGLERAS